VPLDPHSCSALPREQPGQHRNDHRVRDDRRTQGATVETLERTRERCERAGTRTIITFKCTGNRQLARLAAIVRCTTCWTVRSFFDLLALALWTLGRFHRRKASWGWRSTILIGFFGHWFNRFGFNRNNSFNNRCSRSRRNGFLAICLSTLPFFFCPLGTLLGFPATAFLKHGKTRFFGFAQQLSLTFLPAEHVNRSLTRSGPSRRAGRDN